MKSSRPNAERGNGKNKFAIHNSVSTRTNGCSLSYTIPDTKCFVRNEDVETSLICNQAWVN